MFELRSTMLRGVSLPVLGLVLGVLVSCGSPPRMGGDVATEVPIGTWPFAPSSLRVYPLTHLERGDDNKGRIICHIELKDRWGDSSKGVGALRIALYGPGTGQPGAASIQLAKWEVNLSDLTRNTALFDPATRTYRIQLTGVPEWVARLAIGGEAAKGLAPGVTLQATLSVVGSDGRVADLKDEFVVQR